MSIIQNVERIVSPVDFSSNSNLIAESAAYMAGTFGASLHLLFVVQNFEDYSGFFAPQLTIPTLEEELLESAEKKMEVFCENLQKTVERFAVPKIEGSVRAGDVGEIIVDFSTEIDAGMIVMGTHGYKGLEKIMFGSVADKIVRSALCPVLTINPYKCSPQEL